MKDDFFSGHSYLRRLLPEAYRGYAAIHWSMTMDERKVGWLSESFHYRFREILTHTAFRYELAVPCYVLMPDHFHLLAMGYSEDSDQRVAMRFFRKQLNWILQLEGFRLQKQGYDHVLRESSRAKAVFPTVAEYVRENPLRAGLVASHEELAGYRYSGCLVPGYPELNLWSEGFWDSFWKLYAKLQADD